jgi:hypothetical protein
VRLQHGQDGEEGPEGFPFFTSGQQRIGRRASLTITAHLFFLATFHVGTPMSHTLLFA